MRRVLNSIFLKPILGILCLAFLVTAIVSVTSVRPKNAEAFSCCSCCDCYSSVGSATISGWISNWIMINLYIFVRLMLHRIIWFDWVYWQTELLPAMQMMGEQLAAMGTQQVAAIGMFMDATEQLQTQRLLQQLKAEAHKDYHPSVGMCEFGTRVKSLAASERKSEVNAQILSAASINYALSNYGAGASQGLEGVIDARLQQFRTRFCATSENGNKNDLMCPDLDDPNTITTEQRLNINADVDYARVVQHPHTILVDYTANNTTLTQDEQNIFALASNLYRNDPVPLINPAKIQNTGSHVITSLQKAYMRARSVVAKSNVAENSFNALVGLKAEGTAGSQQFLEAYLVELGIPSSEVEAYIGVNPSYDAQMKLLTKTIYQNPKFYTNLYDKPANVVRKGVAMQAIGLMQKFDLYKSYLRTEASLSILLELSVEKLQGEITDAIGALDQAAN